MILLVLFIVFLVLWFVSLFPAASGRIPGAGFFAFICVLLLFFMIHGVRL